MKAWLLLTTRDLEEARHGRLVEAVRREALGLGQPDPLPGLIQGVIDEVRGVIGFSGAAKLDANPAKIAPNLADLVVQKVARVMAGRLNRELSASERDDERTYQSRLEALRTGEWPVDAPTDPITAPSAQGTTGAQLLHKPTRVATRTKLSGL